MIISLGLAREIVCANRKPDTVSLQQSSWRLDVSMCKFTFCMIVILITNVDIAGSWVNMQSIMIYLLPLVGIA